MKKEGSLLLSDYAAEIAATDVLNPNDFNPVLQGLYGVNRPGFRGGCLV